MPDHRFNAVGAYVFAGGFTIGMSEKFNVLAHLEDGQFGVETFKLNFPGIPVYADPPRWPLDALRRKVVDVVYGNPPCSPWSIADRTRKPMDKKEAAMTENMFGLIEKLDPKVWVWESVSQAYGSAMFGHLAGQALEAGYGVTRFLLDAKFMGLPQARRRLFTIFHKVKLAWPAPRRLTLTVAEALRGVRPDEVDEMNYDAEIIPLLRPGEKAIHAWNRLHPGVKKNRPGFLHQRLNADGPSQTITGSNTKIHPTEDRRLSPAEAAVLCGYPRDYRWATTGGQKFKEVAKTVTLPAARYLAEVLYDGLAYGGPVDDGEMWTVNFQARSQRVDDFNMKTDIQREYPGGMNGT
jgi:site-specific DNA-cytosine methylase